LVGAINETKSALFSIQLLIVVRQSIEWCIDKSKELLPNPRCPRTGSNRKEPVMKNEASGE